MDLHHVTVMTTTYNGLPFLREAVESVLAQTAVSLQYLIVDDGSTDETAVYLQSITDPRLIVLQPGRVGRANALNLTIEAATAPFIANLDADDVMLPGRLAQQATFLAQNPDVGLLGSGVLWQTPDGQKETRTFLPDDASLRQRLFTGYPFVHSAVMYRREAIQQAGGFDPNLPCALDYDLCCRIAPHARLANLPDPLVVRRVHGGNYFMQQITPGQYWRALWQIKWRYWRMSGRPFTIIPRLIATSITSGVRKWQSS
jgi:glycosyltransferase involved in cell wall biosynthesis